MACNFSEELSRLAYAVSDFVLMPSFFEPCGLPQMISCKYGSLPVAHDTGGIHDTISRLDVRSGTGNGFLLEDYDSNGLSWAIDRAVAFYKLPEADRKKHMEWIMWESSGRFTHSATASAYLKLHERMLARPLVQALSAAYSSSRANNRDRLPPVLPQKIILFYRRLP